MQHTVNPAANGHFVSFNAIFDLFIYLIIIMSFYYSITYIYLACIL